MANVPPITQQLTPYGTPPTIGQDQATFSARAFEKATHDTVVVSQLNTIINQLNAAISEINNSGNISSATAILNALKTTDGHGSGLDADTVDGKHASDFVPAVDGMVTNLYAITTANDFARAGVSLFGDGSTNTVKPTLGFHQPGLFAGTLVQNDAYSFEFKRQDGASASLLLSRLYQTNPRASDGSRGYIGTDDPRGYPHATKFVTFQGGQEFYGVTNDYQNLGKELSLVANSSGGSITFSTGSKGNAAAIADANLAMRIHNNGNTTIGTATDNGVDKLQVNGSISASNYSVTKQRFTGLVNNGTTTINLPAGTTYEISGLCTLAGGNPPASRFLFYAGARSDGYPYSATPTHIIPIFNIVDWNGSANVVITGGINGAVSFSYSSSIAVDGEGFLELSIRRVEASVFAAY